MQSRLYRTAVQITLSMVLAVPVGASDPTPTPQPSRMVRIPARAFSDASRANLRPKAAVDYGTFLWAELSLDEIDKLQAAGISLEERAAPFTLHLGGRSFDPRVQVPAAAPGWSAPAQEGPNLHLVQFAGPTRAEWLEDLEASGLEVVQYIPPFTYVVWGQTATRKSAEQLSAVRWTGSFAPEFRVLPRWRNGGGGSLNLDVLLYAGADPDLVVSTLEELGGQVHGRTTLNAKFEEINLTLSGNALVEAARIPGIYSIQPVPTDGGLRGEMSDQVSANNVNGSNVAFPGYLNWLAGLGLTGLSGSGVIIANVDGGADNNHSDLVGRFISCTGVTCGGNATSSHGTHTSGIMAADGSSGVMDGGGFLRGLGQAPGANLVEQVYSPWFNQAGGMLLLMEDSFANGASLSGNSWGPAGTPRGYDNDTMQVDIGVRDADSDTAGNQAFSYVLSIMNGYGGTSSQGSPDEAKNIITIGSTKMQTSSGSQILQINDISANSAHGPCLDGRIIPHMVAPGCSVDSTVPGGYAVSGYCGTSMASPHVSGAVAVLIEYFRSLPEYVEDPSPAMIKAALFAVAHDLAGNRDADNGILGHPFDSKQGWGRMDLEAVIDPQLAVRYFDNPMVFDNTGEQWTTDLAPLDPSQPMRLMLVWTDAPGHGLGGSTPAWNNDLDLIVEVGGNTYRGNVFGGDGFSTTGGSADARNNTEGVFLGPIPPALATIRVIAADINSDGIPGVGDGTDQDFALVCYNCASEPGFQISATPTTAQVCVPDSAVYQLELTEIAGFADPVTLSASGQPAGTTAGFDVNPVTPPGTSELTISNMAAAGAGSYVITIEGTAGEITQQTTVELEVFDDTPGDTALTAPPNGAINVALRPEFVWTAATQAGEYEFEIALDTGFTGMVETANGLTETSYVVQASLGRLTTYYWRVRASNDCGAGNDSPTFSFTTANLKANLLVDDDDNSPDVRSYYTDALDALGLDYEIWDTQNSDNEPDQAKLAEYANIIWFTGGEFGGSAGPGAAGEAALSAFLDGTGCLFVSSQEYFYDRGLTSFMQDYLGTASVDSDVSQTVVTGFGTTFGDLGPYTLSYPFTNYSDRVSPNPATAKLVFAGNNGDAAVARDAGSYRTTFWGFPFEAIPAAGDRETAMDTVQRWCGELRANDCNGNGIPDDQDISSGTSLDCNNNAVPDECEPDCNENGIPDDCDITEGTSPDCNENGIPDECEPDCNENGIPDDCDITEGTSPDCNEDGVPDECEPDCNGNGIPDDCDLVSGFSQDCNENAVPDECDIASGSSLDLDENGVPDECELDPPTVEATGCRYLSVTPLPADSSLEVAILVTSPDYPCMADYVTANGLLTDSPVLLTPGQWGSVDVHGLDIVPETNYEVQIEFENGALLDPIGATTAVWGDLVGEFVDNEWTPPDGVVDFIDISAAVELFRNLETAPPWQRGDVAPEVPSGIVDFEDIGQVVDAFRSLAYPYSEPDPCP